MKALYTQDGGQVTLDVIGKVKDGKVDLGRGKDILVAGVPVAEDGALGSCKLIEDEDPKAAPKAAAKTAESLKGKPEPAEQSDTAGEAAEQAAK